MPYRRKDKKYAKCIRTDAGYTAGKDCGKMVQNFDGFSHNIFFKIIENIYIFIFTAMYPNILLKLFIFFIEMIV